MNVVTRRHTRGVAQTVALGACVLLSGLLVACRELAEGALQESENEAARQAAAPYLVSQGDTLELRFLVDRELNADVLVRNDGHGTAPLVGELALAGRTIPEIRALLVDLYESKLRHAGVDVLLKVMHAERVFVGGAVKQPGMIALDRRGMTLLQCLQGAGGPDLLTARLDHVVLCRLDADGKQRAFKVDVEKSFAADEPRPVFVRDGDVILVPPTAIADANRFVSQWFDGMIPGSTIIPSLLLRRGLNGN